MPSGSSDGSPAAAARRLLEDDAADVVLEVVREKRATDPVETLLGGTGRVEPLNGRGEVRYDLSALFAQPGGSPLPSGSATPRPSAGSSPVPGARDSPLPSSSPTPSPRTPDLVDVIWTPTDIYVRIVGAEAGAWESRTRDEGRLSGGLIGRLPDETLGLVSLIAASDPDRAVPLEPAEIDGVTAQRWMVTVPVEAAVSAGVPAQTPDAAVLKRAYGVSEIDIEVWLVADDLRRLRYAFHREKAPYGGPDLTTTTYDWRPAADAIPIEIPD